MSRYRDSQNKADMGGGGLGLLGYTGSGVVSTGKQLDGLDLIKRRLRYWDYMRTGIQFISLQNKVLATVLSEREQEIALKAEEYAKEKEKTREMYKYIALLEKPVEEKLEQIMGFRKVLSLLEQEKIILDDQKEQFNAGRQPGESGGGGAGNTLGSNYASNY